MAVLTLAPHARIGLSKTPRLRTFVVFWIYTSVRLTSHQGFHCSIACDVQALHLVVIHRNVMNSVLAIASPPEAVGVVTDSSQEGQAKNRGLCASESWNIEPGCQ